jgi:hypothetical protein
MMFSGVNANNAPIMIFTTTVLFFLAQTLPVPAPTPETPHGSTHRHHRPEASPAPSPQIRITIVNATSVPTIALSTSGTNLPVTYPDFPQGEWTANEAVTTPEVHYAVRSTNGAILGQQTIRFKPVSSQFLLLTGDLTQLGAPNKLPSPGYSSEITSLRNAPNLQFQVIPYDLVTKTPCHYRIYNAMPGKTLILKSRPEDGKASRELALLTPGNSMLLEGQPESVEYDAVIDGETTRVSIHQEGAERNCLIPFFLKEGRPAFITVFEDP